MPATITIAPKAVSLYEGSTLTTSASSLLVMQFKRYQFMSKEGVGNLLRLIRLHCPSPNQCPSSLYLFNQQFQEAKLSVIPHYFCSTCLQKIDDGHVAHCPNPRCGRDITVNGGMASFIEVPIEQQLKAILECK